MLNRNQKGVIDPVFIIVLVLVLAVGGFIYWRTSQTTTNTDTVQNNQTTENSDNTAENTEDSVLVNAPAEEYIRKAKTPSDWTQVSDPTYGFTFSHPSNWKIKQDSGGNPEQYVYEVGMGPNEQTYAAIIGVIDKDLESAVSRYKNEYINNQMLEISVTGERNIVYDGAKGYEICYKNSQQSECQYFIELGEDMVIQPPVVLLESSGSTDISPEESLQLFESINFL